MGRKPITFDTTDYLLDTVFHGIYLEKFDSSVIDLDRYNQNNAIYREGAVFTYQVQYKNQNNEVFYFKDIDHKWKLVPKSEIDSNPKKFKTSSICPEENLSFVVTYEI